jgi:hypothetical protein
MIGLTICFEQAGLFTIMLLFFHLKLIWNNTSTNEKLKERELKFNYILREKNCCLRFTKALGYKRINKSYIDNDLLRQTEVINKALLD